MGFLQELYTIWKSRVNSATQKRARQVAEKAVYETLIEQGVVRGILDELTDINASMRAHMVKYHGAKDIKLYKESDEDEEDGPPAPPQTLPAQNTPTVDILSKYRNARFS